MLAMNVLQGYKIIRSVRLEWGKNNYLSKTMRQRMQKMKVFVQCVGMSLAVHG